jgi:hypothetical protein
MTTHGTTTTDLGVLGARSARLYHVYARAVDEGDLDTLRAICADDIRITRGDHPTEDGVEAFLDVYRAHIALGIEVCQHAVTNVLAWRDGHTIATRAYFQARLFEPDRTRVLVGEYADTHIERDGTLLIAHKRILVKKVLVHPVAQDLFTYAGHDQ